MTLVSVAGVWKTFEKAGQPGWAAVVPVYNVYVLVAEVADRDIVWVLLSLFVPFLAVIPMIDVAEAFGKGTGYGIGLTFLGFVFFPLLGFGDARYRSASPY
ncbi:signal peptidase I [Halosimplex pelagicum]|uniref:Signal peptidase I n=2 Tax=Halosimplex pelagicum TaxID=869886 RepID=A0A7D5TGC4_9EURY|nr:signal peptidase I [Halosimplex pelagicum]